MDESAAKKLQAKLEEKISDWSLHRLRQERRLKYIVIRLMLVTLLILLTQAVHVFIPQLMIFPYYNLTIAGLAIWMAFLGSKYYRGYNDKRCSRSADEIISLAAQYNEAVKDIPNARHCDFLPPELVQHKRVDFMATVAPSLPIHPVPRI